MEGAIEILGLGLLVLSALYVAAWRKGWPGWLAALLMTAIALAGFPIVFLLGVVEFGDAGMVGAVIGTMVGILPLAWKFVMLVRDEANANVKDVTDRMPSDAPAITKGRPGTIEALAPALHRAARDGTTGVVKALIAAGANVNATTNSGFTALHWAARNGHVNVAKVLMAAGADVNSKDQMGRTPLDFANEAGHSGAVEALSAGGTN